MAGSSEDKRGREIEEDEVVYGYHAGTGSDTDTDDEDARYYLAHRHDGGNDRRGPLSPASSLGSYGTITGAGAAAVASAGFPCAVCRREFTSWKAVGSHMRVHAKAAAKEEDKVSVAAGPSAGASAVDEVGDSVSVSMANVVAEPKVSDDTTTPVQSVCSNNPVVNGGGSGSSSARSSVEPIQSGAAAPVAPPPAPPQQVTFIPLMVPAPQQVPVGVDPPPAAPQHGVFNGPLHIIAGSDPTAWQQAPAGRGFPCRECDRWFPTHQGLGGHAAGHKNRRLAAEARAAAAVGIDPQEHLASRGVPGKPHPCKICGAEYPTGVSLGGHMRKHYSGKPIVPRKRMRLCCLPELALAPPLQQPPPAAPPLQHPPPAAPPQVPAGSVRLFGVTIVQAQVEEEEPPVEHEQ